MNVYEKLGVRRVINAYGNLTPLGGSLMNPEVLKAMAAGSQCFVDLNDLLKRAGQRIATLVGVEAAYITSGASAGLAIATAACVAGKDPENIARLPDTTGMKSEVLTHRCQRNVWDQAVRVAGAKLVEFGHTPKAQASDFESALTDRTAAVLYFVDHNESQSLPLADLIAKAKAHEVPVIVDAASALPPVENLHRFNHMGADLVIFSGGKMIGGPQSTGLILGNQELIEACALNASPNFSIGRSMKVCKEEIAGLIRAVELFLDHDFDVDMQRWERQVTHILNAIQGIDGVTARRVFPGEDQVLPRQVPRVHLSWDQHALGFTQLELQRVLLDGVPSIAVGRMDEWITVNPITLLEGEEKIVARRLGEALMAA